MDRSISSSRAWIVTLSAASFFFYIFIQINLFNAINVEVTRDFNLDATRIGQLASLFFYANALLVFPAGLLLDRYSTRFLILTAATVSTAGTLIFAHSQSYFVAGLGRFLVGTGAAFCFLSCIRIASRWFPPEKMAFVTGIIVTMAMLGGLVAQTPLTYLVKQIGWRKSILFDGLFGVLVIITIFLFVFNRPPGSQALADADRKHLQSLGFWRSFKMAIGNPQNWLGGLYTSLMNLPVFLLGALWGIHYLSAVHHVEAIQASFATTLFFVGVILGSPVFGWFSDHIGRRVLPMQIGAVLSLIALSALLLMPSLSLSTLIILFFIIGFVTSSQVLSYPLIAELNPPALTSTAISVDSVTIMLSGVIFQPFFGWVMSLQSPHLKTGSEIVYSAVDFKYAMWIMPIAFVLSFIITFFLKESYCKTRA